MGNVKPRRQGDVDGVKLAGQEEQKNHSGLLCLHQTQLGLSLDPALCVPREKRKNSHLIALMIKILMLT